MTDRLSWDAIAGVMAAWPPDLADVAVELRDLVLDAAPEVAETVAFNSLCYHKPDFPYGRIGGHVCSIGMKGDCVHLGFIHGAALPDPEGLLTGRAKYKRQIELRTRKDIRRNAFRALIRAALAHDPTK
jgi:hypothetical protein